MPALLDRPCPCPSSRRPLSEPAGDITRRELITGAGVLGVSWMLVACRAGEPDSADPAETRLVTDDTGREVMVPVVPRRIVALSDSNAADQLLSLGAPVVATVSRGGSFELADQYDMEGIADIGEIFEINLEQLAAAGPDLIVGPASDGAPSGYEEVADDIEAIAPTVWLDFFRPVAEVMQRVADLVGAGENLADLRRSYEERVAALREQLGERAERLTVSVVQFNEGIVDVFGQGFFPFGEVLDDLGVGRPESQTTGEAVETCCAALSLEQMSQVDGDVILYYVSSADHSEHPLFRQLDAVRAGQAYEWTDDWWGNTYRALNEVLDDLEIWLAHADADVHPRAG